MNEACTRPLHPRRLLANLVACTLALVSQVHAEDLVDLRLESFGALNAFRPGDMVGIRLQATSRLPAPAECLLQWELPNADGDLMVHTRTLAIAPGQRASRWLYARLPPVETGTLVGTVFTVRAFEARDGERVREIGALRFRTGDAAQPALAVDLRQGLIGVIGEGRMGLAAFETGFEGEPVPSMSEVTRITRVPKPIDLPDRWEGLVSMEALVWGGSGGPQGVPADRLQAIRSWIERGGHLVVVVPEGSDAWGLRGARHGLSDLLPSTGTRVVEGVRVLDLLPLLSKHRDLRRTDARLSMTVFDRGQLDRGWKPLITLRGGGDPVMRSLEGQALVVQRTLGAGRISLVGLDVDALHRQALTGDGLPEADVFWNRVLGRRADAPSDPEYRAWSEAQPTKLVRGAELPYDAGRGESIRAFLSGGQGRTGLLLLVLVFCGAYFAMAVPLPWLMLRRRGLLKWSWPIFAGVALLASAVASLLVSAGGGSAVPVRHLTVIDAVEDGAAEPLLRGVSWMTAELDGFGTATARLGAAGGSDLLSDWAAPGSPSQGFPDTGRGDRSVDEPGQMRLPARSTSTDLQAWWMGKPPAGWGRVVHQDPARPVRTITRTSGGARMGLEGVITHTLPAPLTQVTLIHVGPFTWENRIWRDRNDGEIQPSGLPPRPAFMTTLPAWDGQPLEVGATIYGPTAAGAASPMAQVGSIDKGSLVRELDTKYLDPLLSRASQLIMSNLPTDVSPEARERNLDMLTLFQMLPPPLYRRTAPQAVSPVRFKRSLGRELDLSPWFTRPCLIVTGFLDAQALPVEFTLDGERPASVGTVMIRWILPLPAEDAGPVAPLAGRAVP
jgi:hypothetical protein